MPYLQRGASHLAQRFDSSLILFKINVHHTQVSGLKSKLAAPQAGQAYVEALATAIDEVESALQRFQVCVWPTLDGVSCVLCIRMSIMMCHGNHIWNVASGQACAA